MSDQPTPTPAIVLRVADLARSLTFYRDGLGFTVAEHRPADDLATVVDTDGDVLLFAGPAAGDLAPYTRAEPFVLPAGAPLRYICDNLDIVRANLVAHSITNIRTAQLPWGDPSLVITDPDGYLVRFEAVLHRTLPQALALLNQGCADLEAALAGLSEADFDLTRAPGEWSIRQIIGHLVDGDTLIMLSTVKMALGEPGRTRVANRWNQETWGDTLYKRLEVAPSLALIRATRAYVAALLGTQQDPAERFVLNIAAGDTGAGRKTTVLESILSTAMHTYEHIDEIRQTRQAHGR